MSFILPAPVLEALSRLNTHGFAAYVVGGCVRDLLLGKEPHDFDICTAALPEDVHSCFAAQRIIDTGIRHGTVTVLLGGQELEITTFRTDGDYLDGRHPLSVSFTRTLAEDLKRRDFTVNAMAWSPQEGLVDLFDGQADLKLHRLRCVGDPQKRFTEDALRIMRALRFAAQLGFVIDPPTAQAAHLLRERLQLISRERIAAELLHTLSYPAAPDLLAEFSDVLSVALPSLPLSALSEGLSVLRRLPSEPDNVSTLAALLCGCQSEIINACLDSLKLSRQLHQDTLRLAEAAHTPFSSDDTVIWLSRLGTKQLEHLLVLQTACGTLTIEEADQRRAIMQNALQEGMPLSLSLLPVNGRDLKRLGLRGAEIGDMLIHLHEAVLRGQCPCEREMLLILAKELLYQKGTTP